MRTHKNRVGPLYANIVGDARPGLEAVISGQALNLTRQPDKHIHLSVLQRTYKSGRKTTALCTSTVYKYHLYVLSCNVLSDAIEIEIEITGVTKHLAWHTKPKIENERDNVQLHIPITFQTQSQQATKA